MKHFARFVVEKKWLIILIAGILAVPSLFGVIGTRINYDILTYLPDGLESVIGEQYLDQDFNLASTAMITIDNMPNSGVLKLKDEIKEIEGVEKVIWVDDLVDLSVPKEMLPRDLRDTFYSKKGTMMIVSFEDTSSSKSTMDAISRIKSVLNKDSFIAGLSAISEDTKELSDSEVPVYILAAVILVLIVLFLGLESYLAPFLFLLGIGLAILYNFGSNIFLGQISYITQSLATVLQLGVTMDFSIFLLHRYEEEKSKNPDEKEAMITAIEKTFHSIASSSFTAIAGFLALCAMSLTLGADIGIVMAKGVLIGVISTLTILPALIMIFDKALHRFTHKTVIPRFRRTSRFVTKHYIAIAIVFAALIVPFAFGQSKTNVYYNLVNSLPDNLPSVEGTNKLKEDFNMATSDFILVDENLPDYKVNELTGRIQELDGIELAVSYGKYLGGGIPESFIPSDISDMIRQGGKQLILVNSAYDTATGEQNEQLDRISAIVKSYDPGALITGEAAMTKDLITIADNDFKVVNIVSIIAIFVIIALVFRSASIPLLLVAAIEGAITINMGLSYYTGATLPFIADIVIGTIQLGATINYAILLTNRFREELSGGRPTKEAMQIAIENCSRSIITSALAFFGATISVAVISKMELIQSLCILISRGAVISMLVILIALPAILIIFSKVIRKTSYRWLLPKHE